MADSIVFAPLTAVPNDTTVEGVLRLAGEVFGQIPENTTAEGALYLDGDADMLVLFSATEPAIPGSVDGGLVLFANVAGTAREFGDYDGGLFLGGQAFGLKTAASTSMYVDDGLRLEGQVVSPLDLSAFGFLIESPFIMYGYGGLVYESIEEGVAFAGARTGLPIHVIEDVVAAATEQDNAADVEIQIEEAVSVGERLAIVFLALLEAGVVFSPAVNLDFRMLARVVERLVATGTCDNYAEAVNAVVDGLAFGILTDLMAFEKVEDTLLSTTEAAEAYTAAETIVNRLIAQGSAAAAMSMTLCVREDVVLDSAVSSGADMKSLVREAVGMAVSFSVDNGEYIAWSINTLSQGISRYDAYPYNSFAKVGGKYLGLSSGGLYELAGDTDDGAPIGAKIRLGMWDLGTRLFKRFPECYIGFSGDGDLLLRTITPHERTGEKCAATYRIHPRGAASTRESKFALGKGVKAVDWDFELENIDGSDFNLASIVFHPLRTDRRTRG